MNELIRLAHEFLQNFCLGNHQNQELLHKHIDLFLTHDVSPSRWFGTASSWNPMKRMRDPKPGWKCLLTL